MVYFMCVSSAEREREREREREGGDSGKGAYALIKNCITSLSFEVIYQLLNCIESVLRLYKS